MPGGRTEPSTNLRLRLALTPAMPSPTSHWRVSIGNLGRAPIRSGKWKPTFGSIRSRKPNLLACRQHLIPDPLTANALATVPRKKMEPPHPSLHSGADGSRGGQLHPRGQNSIRPANWMLRGLLTVPFHCPKTLLPESTVVLKALPGPLPWFTK